MWKLFYVTSVLPSINAPLHYTLREGGFFLTILKLHWIIIIK